MKVRHLMMATMTAISLCGCSQQCYTARFCMGKVSYTSVYTDGYGNDGYAVSVYDEEGTHVVESGWFCKGYKSRYDFDSLEGMIVSMCIDSRNTSDGHVHLYVAYKA